MGDGYWQLWAALIAVVLLVLLIRSVVARQLAHRRTTRTGSLERWMAHLSGHHIRREPYGRFGWFSRPYRTHTSAADSPMDGGTEEEAGLFLDRLKANR